MKNLKRFSLFLLLALSITGLESFCKEQKNINKVVKHFSRLSFAVMHAHEKEVKKCLDSGVDVAHIRRDDGSSSTLIYDALFINNKEIRSSIVNMLLRELLKSKYDSIREDYLNLKNVRDAQAQPETVLEKSFSIGDHDIAERLVAAGANCDDSKNPSLLIFYGQAMLRIKKASTADAKK